MFAWLAALMLAVVTAIAPPAKAQDGATVANLAGAWSSPYFTMKHLRGAHCAPPNRCIPLDYSNFPIGPGRSSIDSGVTSIDNFVRTTPGPKVVVGASLGALAIYAWLRQYSHDPTAPPPNELRFITIASPERKDTGRVWSYSEEARRDKYGNHSGIGMPLDTPYNVIDVCREWDGWCYWIPGDKRSERGASQLHVDYRMVDINDPNNIVATDGNVRWVLNPTPGY